MKRSALPRWCSEFQNRHGKWTLRFRRQGWPTVYPKSRLGTEEFAQEYLLWRAGQPREIGAKRTKPGSMKELAVSYFNSSGFRGMKDSTQGVYRNIINRLCDEVGSTGIRVGEMPAAGLQKKHILKLMAARAAKPDSANGLRKVLRAMMQHAVEMELRHDDPTRDIKPMKPKSKKGFHSWSEDEIAAFEARHPVGTKARLAFALLLCTGQRRSDVVIMGRQHIRDGAVHVRQLKTGTELDIPILPELQVALDTATGNMTFLVTEFGKPFTAAGFGNWFRERCDEANLRHCSAHGLRKAAARRLADVICSVHEIAAITGHASLREVQHYTKGADQKRLAASAMEKMKTRTLVG